MAPPAATDLSHGEPPPVRFRRHGGGGGGAAPQAHGPLRPLAAGPKGATLGAGRTLRPLLRVGLPRCDPDRGRVSRCARGPVALHHGQRPRRVRHELARHHDALPTPRGAAPCGPGPRARPAGAGGLPARPGGERRAHQQGPHQGKNSGERPRGPVSGSARGGGQRRGDRRRGARGGEGPAPPRAAGRALHPVGADTDRRPHGRAGGGAGR